MKSEDLEKMKNKSLSEISKRLLNLRFRNFTNINGENVLIGKQRKKKGRFFIKVSCLSFLSRKGKKETYSTLKGIAQGKRRSEKKAKDGHEGEQGQKQAKERIRKKLSKRKRSIVKKQKKIVVTLEYIISAVD